MCDVPSIAVFCSESIECFPGTVSNFFFKLLDTIPVAPIITGTIVHLRFHIRCISIRKLLYFNYFIIIIIIIIIITVLFKMIVGVLTTCHTQYTTDSGIYIFLFNRTTLQVFVTYFTGAL